jgi:hypothetical protein
LVIGSIAFGPAMREEAHRKPVQREAKIREYSAA